MASVRARAELAARRAARPMIDRVRPILLADQARALDAARANIAALEVLVDDLTRRVAELEAREADVADVAATGPEATVPAEG